ncbi:GH92 family glycosyl hydrolase [Bacteroidales bacterium OttesenSCG-928-M11]|nr:GH92 family glycosyl hydrolase [Bacteroidales bacterium OttesenSCG-928-M11]
MNRNFLPLLLLLVALLFGSCKRQTDTLYNLTQYVDPYIGSGGHGHVFVGASVPFGFVQLGPTSIPQDWDWTSGYHYSDTTIVGFAHTHLSGTGIGDLSDVVFMPVVGETTLSRGQSNNLDSGCWSFFTRNSETVKPGYYAVHLDRYNIDVELTSTARSGFHRYTFPSSGEICILVNLENGQGWDSPVEGFIEQEAPDKIKGYRYSRGWANKQEIYFAADFSKPIKRWEVINNDAQQTEDTSNKGRRIWGKAYFDVDAGETIQVKVGLSAVGTNNARENLEAEIPHWNFNEICKQADNAWNNELQKIKIETSCDSVKRIFYTALYHTMIAPSLYCDVNGEYRGADKEVHPAEGFINYTTFSLWDTYRSAHPLMTLIHPEKVNNMINTMLHIFEQQGKLPVWHLMSCETDCMIGNPAIPVVADAMLKGFDGFDYSLAYNAMYTSAMLDERGQGLRKQYGYIPYDLENEALSKCMEYAIADWSLAQTAQMMGKTDDYEYFLTRSRSYKSYFDASTGFVRGLSSQKTFRPNLNPFSSSHRENDYCEGNAWQYTWLVPHDIEGLVELFGGAEPFVAKLDSLFVAEGSLGENASPDISGLIGQYAHGNEPSHHVAYIYSCIGQPNKTAVRVREILNTMYSAQPDGLCGNEDVGQMSAWYILSALGFYQVEPAGGKFVFGSPLIDQAILQVGGGKTFTINVKNNSRENIYIQNIKLRGNPYTNYYLSYEDIVLGGELEITMGPDPKDCR